ncbi:PKD domain-containing protein [Maribacter sp. 2210JD10-5]|uniref:PKD domain-containing protein n=1 Tax=Maribacter sp. 2210JD10-5 TaxID=3386272 RepID=UPI0039BC70FD
MKTFKLICALLILLVLSAACDNTINYDQFDTAPIIEDVAFTVTENPDDPKTISISAMATGNDYYEIDWGDGTLIEQSDSGEASHSYAENGSYSVTITARKDGLVNEKASQVVDIGLISNLVLITEPDPNDSSRILLNASANSAINYDIDWGDGSEPESTATGEASHVYEAGEYEILVTATAPQREPLTKTAIVNVVAGGVEILINETFEDGLGGFAAGEGIGVAPSCAGQGITVTGANSTTFAFDEPISGSVSIEYLFRTNNVTGTFSSMLINQPTNGRDGRIQININNGLLEYKIGTGGENPNLAQTGQVVDNQCYTMRIDIDREANTIKFFLDGIQQGDASGYQLPSDFGDTLFNARLITFVDPMNPTPEFSVDNFKISKTTAVEAKAVLLEEQFNDGLGGFTAGTGVSIEEGCAGPGININSNNNSRWDFDTPIEGSVAIEYLFRSNNVTGTFSSFLVNQPDGNNNGRIQININNGLLEYKVGSGGENPTLARAGQVANNECYAMRIEIDRDGNNIKFFLDGVQQGDAAGYTLADDFGETLTNIRLITFVDPMNPAPDFNVDNIKITEL